MPTELDKAISDTIVAFEGSEARAKMTTGEAYYRTDNIKINKRRMLTYGECEDGGLYEQDDPYKSNFKMASSYYKLLVDQKVSYSLGKPIVVEDSEIINAKMQKQIKKAGKNASKKGIGWLQSYIDDNEFKIVSIQPEQCIPMWSADDSSKLDIMIRYYAINVMTDKGEMVQVNRVEVWDNEQVTYFQQATDTKLYCMIDYESFGENPKMHFKKNMSFKTSTTNLERLGWGQVPFSKIYNNDEEEYDLKTIKNYIDVYDWIQSDFANTITENTSVYWVLKGYEGEPVADFMQKVKRHKTIKVGEDGDARAETIEIPHAAFIAEIENLEDKIYKFGQGVNMTSLAGGDITNVVIKAMFSELDLKANQFEEEIEEAIESIVDLYNVYASNSNQAIVEAGTIEFNRSMIMNEVELATLANESRGSLSEETRLANDPRVDDTDEEIERMKAEREEAIIFNDDMNEVDNNGTNTATETA
jgi:SPP1 family phage portal protein